MEPGLARDLEDLLPLVGSLTVPERNLRLTPILGIRLKVELMKLLKQPLPVPQWIIVSALHLCLLFHLIIEILTNVPSLLEDIELLLLDEQERSPEFFLLLGDVFHMSRDALLFSLYFSRLHF